jgi:hypothetical protein
VAADNHSRHGLTVAAKVETMMEMELIPYEISAKWVEDQDDPDWLVIYAAKRKDEDAQEYYDGFFVCHIQFSR